MDPADILTLPGAAWEAEYLEDTSLRRLTLEFYDREHAAIARYLSFLGVDVETAREIVQETFLKLHEHLLKGGEQHNLRAWLYRVAHNLARNAQAAFSASKTDSLPDVSTARDFRASMPSAEERTAGRRTRETAPRGRPPVELFAEGMPGVEGAGI